jgi:GH24 family phage-related lysozyme (muramidase)
MTKLKDILIKEEGDRQEVYKDHLGNWTIGIGHLIGTDLHKMTLPKKVTDLLFKLDLQECIRARNRIFGRLEVLTWSKPRRIAVTCMIFQLGETNFRGFHTTIKHIKLKEWEKASQSASESLWARQVPLRAKRVCYMLKTGEYDKFYL